MTAQIIPFPKPKRRNLDVAIREVPIDEIIKAHFAARCGHIGIFLAEDEMMLRQLDKPRPPRHWDALLDEIELKPTP